jgi:hypothetical protein
MEPDTLIRPPVCGNADGRATQKSGSGRALHFWRGLLLALSISGCASQDGIRVPGPGNTVPSDQAIAVPPPGGPAIVTVLQHNYSNAVVQDIFLFTSAATPGQNVLRVTVFGPVGPDDRGSLGYASIRDSDINSEMRRQFPGVVMVRNGDFLQNHLGPFGYALGRGRSGDTCLFAWQQIRSSQNARAAFVNRGTIQVRLRLCDARATEQQLLSVMYGITIVGTFSAPGWNPYDSPPGIDPSLGRPGQPIYPGVPANHANPPPPAFQLGSQPQPVAPRRRAPVTTVPARPQPAPEPIGPAVPLPISPGATTQRPPAATVVPVPNCVATPGGTCN